MGARAILASLPALINQAAKEQAYRVYVTDALKIIGENTAKYAGGSYIKVRYLDIESPKPEETRTPKEVIAHMKQKIASV
jgi:hypothetical protein|nr:MAG TPA: hypothetical protein [Caudoviricetes sp.]